MPADPRRIVPQGGVIGIIGGGQLGRMTALAAARLGYKCHIFCPEPACPASQVAFATTTAAYEDKAALAAFAEAVDVVTFEFENIPADSVRILAEHVPVRPGWKVLETAQDRVVEKSFFNDLGIATAPWRAVGSLDDLTAAVAALGRPSVLKTNRFGYDGKGQVKIAADTDLAEAWEAIGKVPAILEGFVDFDCEVSVIVARGLDGKAVSFDLVENRHKNHILDVTVAPADVPAALAAEGRAIADKAAQALDLVGLLAIELFVTKDGRLLVNEMAPRPHNSGHWTMDACLTDQFEQFTRAVCGLPLGDAARHCDATMTNLIGDDILDVPALLAEPGAKLHLYGKAEARPGRKMGHVNRLFPRQVK